MKLIISTILLLTFVLIYILFAASNLYTLQKESKNDNDVITWFNKKIPEDNPVSVKKRDILVNEKKISLESSSYFKNSFDDLFGIVQISGKRSKSDLQVNWYNMEGDQIGTFKKSWFYDYPLPVFHIDPVTKNLIYMDIFTDVRVINPEGEIFREFSILPGYKYHSENIIYMELVNNHIVTGIMEIIPGKNQMARYMTFLRIMDLEGNTLLRYDLPDWQLGALASSNDGKYLAASLYKMGSDQSQSIQFQTTILDDNGGVIYQIPIGFQKGIFNQKNDRILLIDNKTCYLYNFLKKFQLGSYTTKNKDNIFIAAAFLPPSDMVALEEGRPESRPPKSDIPWIYDNIYIKTLDGKGAELNELALNDITLYKPAFKYNKDTQTLFIGHSNGWQLYRIEF